MVSKRFAKSNGDVPGVLQAYSIKIRKGFPFGFEITGDVGYLSQTSLVFGGADVRFYLLQGFRTRIPPIFPEIAVGGSVRTVTGTPELQLTVAGFDAEISKPIPIAGTLVFTPYAGYQWIRIFGDSGLIDFTPNTDAVNYCGYTGNNTPATPDPAKKGQFDGQPICKGSSADFNNVRVFDPVRLTRHRLQVGGQFRVQMIKLGVHFDIDLVAPEEANKGSEYMVADPTRVDAKGKAVQVNEFGKDSRDPAVGKQLTVAFDIGAVF